MARSDPQVNIRMPAELKSLLETASAESKRSLNQEIVSRLLQSFNPQPGKPFDMEQYQTLKHDIMKDMVDFLEQREKTKNKKASD
jgi:hypothetical protein